MQSSAERFNARLCVNKFSAIKFRHYEGIQWSESGNKFVAAAKLNRARSFELLSGEIFNYTVIIFARTMYFSNFASRPFRAGVDFTYTCGTRARGKSHHDDRYRR